jgi:hypothetical protein
VEAALLANASKLPEEGDGLTRLQKQQQQHLSDTFVQSLRGLQVQHGQGSQGIMRTGL